MTVDDICKDCDTAEYCEHHGWCLAEFRVSDLDDAPVGEPAAMPPEMPEIQVGDRVKATNYKDAVLIDQAHIAAWFNERPFLVESVERCVWRRTDRKEP